MLRKRVVVPRKSSIKLLVMELAHDQKTLHRNRRLPDERARQRAGRRQSAPPGLRTDPRADDADVILFNTCSVREHAEDKIYSALGRLRGHKQRHPDKVIGVLGCMAQKDQELIRKRAPYVDIVCGTGQLAQLPELIAEVQNDRRAAARRSAWTAPKRRGTKSKRSFESYDPMRDPSMRPNAFQAYVRIMIGCDKFCTYCIVPSVRGPEQSRHPEQIAAEVRQLAGEGCKEITLLGQTVNSYQFRRWAMAGRAACPICSHAFTTRRASNASSSSPTFPRDMSDDLLDAVRGLPKVCPYLHVPAQSGCNEVLKRMKRLYTVEYYRDMLARCRETRAGRGDQQRFHRRLLRRDGRVVRADLRPGARRRLQEQLHLQVQPAPRHQGARTFRRRRAGRGQETPQQRSAGHPKRRQPARPSSPDRRNRRGAGRRAEQERPCKREHRRRRCS